MNKTTKIKNFCRLGIFTKNSKKAQGISINIIIIAAIALLVLVILSVIFIGKIGTFSTSVGDCKNKGGQCVLASEDCPADYPSVYLDWTCPDVDEESQRCCIKVEA